MFFFQTEKRVNELIREKENMATEIWQLKRDLEKVKEGVTSGDDHVTTGGERKHIDNYDPDSPNILKRKIGNSRLLRSTISRLCVRDETRDHKLLTPHQASFSFARRILRH